MFMNYSSFAQPMKFFAPLQEYCSTLEKEFDQIAPERKAALEEIADYIAEKYRSSYPVNIVVICTHNSRRSHMGQLWLEAAAAWYGLYRVYGSSGGTEATAFNPRAVTAMQRAGFEIEMIEPQKNPYYRVLMGTSDMPRTIFSKRYDDPVNPKEGFAAVMVCADADEACPIVPGAEDRFAIPYDDPKHFDNTPQEQEKYDECCRQIAREFFYMMRAAKRKI